MGNVRSFAVSHVDWLAKGALAPHVEAFKKYLTDRGYAAHTISKCVGSIAHFARWLDCRRLGIRRIDEAVVTEVLDEHLPDCKCAGLVLRARIPRCNASAHQTRSSGSYKRCN